MWSTAWRNHLDKFIRITVLGGLLFLLPFAVLAVLVGKLVSTARPIVEPVLQRLPLNAIAGFSATILLTAVLIIVVSFAAGFVARTGIAKRLVKELETSVLNRVPACSGAVPGGLLGPPFAETMPRRPCD